MARGGSYYALGDRTYWLPDGPQEGNFLDIIKIVKDRNGNPMSPEDVQRLQAEDGKTKTGASCLSAGPDGSSLEEH